MPRILARVVAASSLLFLVGVQADHPQDPQENGTTITFDHVKGNEWWVEVKLAGTQAFDLVAARDEGGPWVVLEKKSWGVWAGSFHIEPGHHVQFEALYTVHDGERTRSCWFTHPDGVERCDYQPGDLTRFDHTGGNEWWVQVKVGGAPSAVQAQDDGGPWIDLQKRSWGDWAASFRIEPGHDVRFRALVDGAWKESCWFTHPGGVSPDGDGTCTGSEGADPGPGGPAPMTFDHRGGNQWWVEVSITGGNIYVVHAEDSGGQTHRLTLREWGNWAGSFHIAPGESVRFHVNDRDGSPTVSSCWFTHPEGKTPTGGETCTGTSAGAPQADVAFAPKAGNSWWVETYALSNGSVTAVAARVDGGTWKPLEKKQWGAWAASFHVPQGSSVELRATTASGEAISMAYHWPSAVPVSERGTPWPHEGSYLRFAYEENDYHDDTDKRIGYATWAYRDGTWHVFCEEREFRGTSWPFREYALMAPPFGGRGLDVGQRVEVDMHSCQARSYDVVVKQAQTRHTHIEGRDAEVAVWYGSSDRDNAAIEQQTGWMVSYSHHDDAGYIIASLEDTDAPLPRV
jgi:hypothetical protein